VLQRRWEREGEEEIELEKKGAYNTIQYRMRMDQKVPEIFDPVTCLTLTVLSSFSLSSPNNKSNSNQPE
jgi:hypothetical protein